MNFRIRGLEARQFDHLFALSDAELAARGAVRRIADGPRPCRISLSDARGSFESASTLIASVAAQHSITRDMIEIEIGLKRLTDATRIAGYRK